MALSPKGIPQSIRNGTARIQAEICCYHLEVSEDRIWAPRVSENEGRYPRNEGFTGGLALTYVCKFLPNSWLTLKLHISRETLGNSWRAESQSRDFTASRETLGNSWRAERQSRDFLLPGRL